MSWIQQILLSNFLPEVILSIGYLLMMLAAPKTSEIEEEKHVDFSHRQVEVQPHQSNLHLVKSTERLVVVELSSYLAIGLEEKPPLPINIEYLLARLLPPRQSSDLAGGFMESHGARPPPYFV